MNLAIKLIKYFQTTIKMSKIPLNLLNSIKLLFYLHKTHCFFLFWVRCIPLICKTRKHDVPCFEQIIVEAKNQQWLKCLSNWSNSEFCSIFHFMENYNGCTGFGTQQIAELVTFFFSRNMLPSLSSVVLLLRF